MASLSARPVIFKRSIYYMPKQTQVEYWESAWDDRDFQLQVDNGYRKAWWPHLTEILEKEVGNEDLIVEAGCGLGQFVYMLHGMGKKVMGVDVTERAIERTKSAHPELDLQVQDIRDFDLEDDSVKLMISLGVVEHFPEGPHEPLKEAARVIEPGGILFITIPFNNHFRRWRELWWRLKYFFLKQEWFRDLTKQREVEFYQYTYLDSEAKEFLRDAGFEVEKVFLHHTHETIRKDFLDSWWFRRIHHKAIRRGKIPMKHYKKWAEEQEAEHPEWYAHIALYVARRVS